MSLKFTLCVPTKNRDKDIIFLLDSLLKQTYKKFKIIIVDASNNNLTKKVINNYKKKLDILYTTDFNGLTSQVNKGLRLTKSEYFMRTDDDAVFSKNVINEIIKQLENKKELGGVSVQTITPDHSSRDIFLFLSKFEKGNIFWKMIGHIYKSLIMDNQIYKISKSLPSGAFSLGSNFKKYIKKNNFYHVDLLECTSLCFRTKILKKIGGFNNFYRGTSEYHEAEACAKVRQQNYKLGLSTHSFLYHNTSKKGVYSARYNTYERLENFIFYYLNNVFEIKLKFLVQFISYIIFQICYGFFMGLKMRNIKFFGCIFAPIFTPFKFVLYKLNFLST